MIPGLIVGNVATKLRMLGTINPTRLQPFCVLAGGWTTKFKPMRKLWLKVKQSTAWRVLCRAYARWTEEDGDQRAAAFGYYLLLSLLPLTILLVTAGSLFVEREVATQAVVKWINQYTPLSNEQERSAVAGIREWLQARGKISLAALPLLLWGALKFLRTLIRTTNRVWHSQTYSWWRLPLKSLTLLGITASAVLIGILLPGFARLVQAWLNDYLAFPSWAFAVMFHILPWLVLFYGLIMIFKLAPSRPTKFSEVWLGALGATVLIWIGELLFLVYATNFNSLYGALGGIAAFLLWVYLSGCIGVFGICVCAAQVELRGETNDPSK